MVKILLAEDDLFLRDLYIETFKDEGFDVAIAIDGAQAQQKIKEGGWDLVLLDVLMPQMSGIEVLKKIKGSQKTYAKHIVMMTNSDEENVGEVRDMIDGFILKSTLNPLELVSKVKEYLNK